jgi:anthranilate synthase component 2
MKILVLDNYDSFTFNLVHILRELGYGDQIDMCTATTRLSLAAVAPYDKISAFAWAGHCPRRPASCPI